MDTSDRFDPNLPVPFPGALSPPSGLAPAFSSDLATTPLPQISSRVLLRGFTRHWWHILLLSLLVFLPVAYLLWRYVEPTYESFIILRVEPSTPKLYSPRDADFADSRSVEPYLQTQVILITSGRVLKEVINDPSVVKLPVITKSGDPESDLRKKLSVEVDAYLIRIALELPNAEDAATIIDAVVKSYLEYTKEFKRSTNWVLIADLKGQFKLLEAEIAAKKQKLKALYGKGTIKVSKPDFTPKKDGDSTQPTFVSYTQEQVGRMIEEIVKTDLELITARAALDVRSANRPNEEENAQQSQQDDEQFEARIREEFQKDPDVIAHIGELAATREQLAHAKSVARLANDPGRRAAEKRHKQLTEEYEELWKSKYDEIKQRLKVAVGTARSPEAINELKIRVEELKQKQEKQASLFEKMKNDEKTGNNDTFEVTFLNDEVQRLIARQDQVAANLAQLDFESKQDFFRVQLVDPAASHPKIATNSKLIKYMAAAPVGILFTVLGLFLLLEIKAQRVDDPDTLSTRIRSEVYALPPLPTTRSGRKLSAPEADDQIQQFIQRLDHLRFGICGNPTELGKGRCVLIASAVSGEGKTALAAHLAARCGTAGMSTLLIDADLRRAGLCALLDVPEGLGLSDVLKEEATIEEVVIPVQGGTFYLLPAGTPIKDTSRVLQSRNFASLITQLRQLYDLIIIDSPPVLPVPDALILGRCTDGAVLAARYDISRFPQVERARRQLDSAGIAILGTVINGMRHSDTYYGRYSYNRQRSSQPNSSNTI